MAPIVDRNGKPINITFVNLLFGISGSPQTVRTTKGVPAFVRDKPKKTPSPAVAPKSPSPQDATPNSPTATAKTPAADAATSTAWSETDDQRLLGMKAQNKSWLEIETALESRGKDRAALKQRYRELFDADVKKKGEDEGGEGGKEGKRGTNAPGKFKDKGKDKWKGREKEGKNQPKKGVLKESKGKGKGKAGDLKDINGHPVIYLESGDDLSAEDLAYLYRLNAECDGKKWTHLASRFFDKTGRRISEDALKEKLKNC